MDGGIHEDVIWTGQLKGLNGLASPLTTGFRFLFPFCLVLRWQALHVFLKCADKRRLAVEAYRVGRVCHAHTFQQGKAFRDPSFGKIMSDGDIEGLHKFAGKMFPAVK